MAKLVEKARRNQPLEERPTQKESLVIAACSLFGKRIPKLGQERLKRNHWVTRVTITSKLQKRLDHAYLEL